MQCLIQKIRVASNIDQKGHILLKKGTTNFSIPYSNLSLSVLYQNKALCNFHKKGQRSESPTVFLSRLEPDMCLKESCFLDCWKVSSVSPVFKNVGERAAA